MFMGHETSLGSAQFGQVTVCSTCAESSHAPEILNEFPHSLHWTSRSMAKWYTWNTLITTDRKTPFKFSGTRTWVGGPGLGEMRHAQIFSTPHLFTHYEGAPLLA
jgi:hypothetical protein